MIPFRLWENEKVLFQTRMSWVILMPKFFGALVYFGVPFAIISLLLFSALNVENITLPAILIGTLISFLSFAYAVMRWRRPVLFVTTKRVLFVHKKLFSGKKVEVQLKNISEVVSVKKNFINALFNFGSLLIAPLSGTQKFRVLFIPKSDEVAEYISEYSAQEKKGISSASSNTPAPTPSNTVIAISGADIQQTLRGLPGIKDIIELDYEQKDRIAEVESQDNRGIFEILRRNRVFCVLREGKVDFPSVCMVGLPSLKVHEILAENFNNVKKANSIVLVGV